MIFKTHLSIILIIIATFIVGFVRYQYYKKSKVRYFLYFLGYMVISECIAYSFKIKNLAMFPLYNISMIIYFSFYFFLFGNLLIQKIKRTVVRVFFFLFLIVSLSNIFFIQTNFNELQTYTFFIGSFLLIITISLFYIEVFNNVRSVHPFIYFYDDYFSTGFIRN